MRARKGGDAVRICYYCDRPPGLEGLAPYEAGGVVEHLHPSCMKAMLEAGSCCGDDEEDEAFKPVALSPGGEA